MGESEGLWFLIKMTILRIDHIFHDQEKSSDNRSKIKTKSSIFKIAVILFDDPGETYQIKATF